MSLTTQALAAAALNAVCDAVVSGGFLSIYTGSAPATVAAAPTGTLLAQCALSAADPFAAASGANPPVAVGNTSGSPATFAADASANATGTAGYFRIETSGSAGILQGSVGTSGADLNLSTLSIVAGNLIQVTAMSATLTGIS